MSVSFSDRHRRLLRLVEGETRPQSMDEISSMLGANIEVTRSLVRALLRWELMTEAKHPTRSNAYVYWISERGRALMMGTKVCR